MTRSEKEILRRLGAGTSIATVCEAAGMTRDEFDAWWLKCTADRVPGQTGACPAPVNKAIDIQRDQWGIPHISAATNDDLFFG